MMSRLKKMPHSNGDGNHVHKEILLHLPPEDCSTRKVPDSSRPTSSTAALFRSERLPQCNQCGSGAVRQGGLHRLLPLIAGFLNAPTRAVVQVQSTVFRVDARAFTAILEQRPTPRHKLQQFAQIALVQVTQIAACNRLDDIQ
jgi:hypothetical protein